jgi:hypothetical protein
MSKSDLSNVDKFQDKLEVEKRTARNLTRLYIIALSALAFISILGQWLIHHTINDQLSDSHVINLAGTQRYKCQQICKTLLLIHSNIDHSSYPDKIAALKNMLVEWKKGHEGLQKGNLDLHLPGNNSDSVKILFQDINLYFDRIYNSANQFISLYDSKQQVSQEKLNSILKVIFDNESIFLLKMNGIVKQYSVEAKEKVLFLKEVERFLFIVTILILIAEGFFIFRPVTLKIKNTIHELVIAEVQAEDLATKVRVSNDSLEKSLKELKDIYFALEHATILAKTDRYGIINYVNDRFCEISKYSREELIGNRFHLLSGHYHSKAFFDTMWETITHGTIWNNEIQNRAKDGTYFWLDATIVPVLDKTGAPYEYMAIYTDVTQRFKQSIHEQKIRTTSIIEGQEKERRKIARELHDGLGQMLTALKFSMEGLKPAPGPEEKEKFEEIKKLLYETIGEVRKISFNLMPTVLNDFGIGPALKHLCEQASKSSNISIIFENNSTIDRLSKTVEINLYRIIQEALNNAIKYAQADEVKVKLNNGKEFLQLEIADNGKGFTVQNIPDKNKKSISGNGITNIQERTSLVDGQFRIETAPGMGTKIVIKVPLKI